jgi:HK97 family phage portal protein
MANPITRALQRLVGRSLESGVPGVEGQPKEGPWYTINSNGWLPPEWGKYINFWQMDYDPLPGGSSAIVEACIAAYAQTIAMCPGDHWWANEAEGGRERVTNSALSRILKRPNDYQSRSDFLLNLASDLYRDGNSYALATRNDRYEVAALHPFDPRRSRPVIGPDGAVFYELAGNNVIEGGNNGFVRVRSGSIVAPARDVLHVKLEPRRAEPLVGVAPAQHAMAAINAQRAISSQLINMFGNMNRPAGVIETDANIQQGQIDELRKRFTNAWKGIDNLAGGPPILTNGFKFKGISMSAKDSELIMAAKLTEDEIFAVFGVPPAILGLTDRSTFASTEALMQFWLARGLGFAINHIEVGMDHFFGLKGWPYEWVEFDTSALLRVAYKDRIEALARGVQGGIYAPNEARNAEDLPDADYGDEPRVQQQVVPLSAWAQTPPQTPAPEAPPPAPPAGGEEPEPAEAEEEKSLLLAFDRGDTGHVDRTEA